MGDTLLAQRVIDQVGETITPKHTREYTCTECGSVQEGFYIPVSGTRLCELDKGGCGQRYRYPADENNNE